MKKFKKPLSETHPELAKEADGWDPAIVNAGTKEKRNWISMKWLLDFGLVRKWEI